MLTASTIISQATYKSPRYGPGQSVDTSIKVMTPDGAGKFPVFMWLMGTGDEFAADTYNEFATFMANAGYIAAIPDYSNEDMCMNICGDASCTLSLMQLYSVNTGDIKNIGQPEKVRALMKALDVLCAMPKADCSLGVAVSGHSQGAYSTVMLATMDSRVTAISPWSYGYVDLADKSGLGCVEAIEVDKKISKEKRRMLIGAKDDLNGLAVALDMKGPQAFSGYTCDATTAPIDCIQTDGSGYYVFAESEYTTSDPAIAKATHGFFGSADPVVVGVTLLDTFKNGAMKWNMVPTFNWLSEAARVTTVEPTTVEPTTVEPSSASSTASSIATETSSACSMVLSRLSPVLVWAMFVA
jgi:dienelactone hydrolase